MKFLITKKEMDELIEKVSSRIEFQADNALNRATLKLAATVAILTIQEYEKMKAEKQ